MFNVCMRMLNNRDDAEDALQDAFTEVFVKLDRYRYESAFGAWTKRIMINTCVNLLRKKRVSLIYKEEIPDTALNDEEDEDGMHRLSVERVLKAMHSLPDGYRVIFSLYTLEGYDHGEISQILGITESTSRTQYRKAKLRLKELLINQG